MLGVCLIAAPASAELIEFTFAGEIEQANGDPPGPWGPAEVGQLFEVRYVFDTEEPDQNSAASLGIYNLLEAEITVDGIAFDATGYIRIDLDGVAYDYEAVFAFGELEMFSEVLLIGDNLYTNDDLLTDIILDEFTTGRAFRAIWSDGIGGLGIMRGDLDTFSRRVIPTPGILNVLLISGLRINRRQRS
jgi:hypothetical protein